MAINIKRCPENSNKITIAHTCSQETIKSSPKLERDNSRYKNGKQHNVDFLIYQGQIKTFKKQ
jgi:hypothetical protein